MASEAAKKLQRKLVEFIREFDAITARGEVPAVDQGTLGALQDEIDALYEEVPEELHRVTELRARIETRDTPRIEVIVYQKRGVCPLEISRIVEVGTEERLDVDGFVVWDRVAPRQIEGANLVVLRYETDPEEK